MIFELETERLLLRPIKEDDVQKVYDCWMQDEEVSKYMCWKASKDIKHAFQFVKFELGNIDNNKWNRWIIEKKSTGEVIGTCLIYWNDEENNWDISYNLGQKYWKCGYTSEAMAKVMEYAKEDLGVKECIAVHAIENKASEKVIRKLGFMFEKDVPLECSEGDIKTTGKYYRLKL